MIFKFNGGNMHYQHLMPANNSIWSPNLGSCDSGQNIIQQLYPMHQNSRFFLKI